MRVGNQIELEYDQQLRDKYNRLLAFVWLPNGRMLNETIVCEGYGNALTRYPFRSDYMERFRVREHHARETGKGLWAEDGMKPETETSHALAPRTVSTQGGEIHGNRRSMVYHLPGCPSYNAMSPVNVIPFANEEDAIAAGYRKAGNCR